MNKVKNSRVQKFIENYEKKVVSLSKKLNLADYNATITGSERDYKTAMELHIKLSNIYSDKEDFTKLKNFINLIGSEKQLYQRQINLIYNDFAGHQFDKKLLENIICLSTKIEKKYTTFRANFNGIKITDNEIDNILSNSIDSLELEKTWKASKEIGKVVENDVLKLVKLRNKGARSVGFDNFHQMSLELAEQKESEIDKLFYDLNNMTSQEYTILKREIDSYLSKRFDLSPNDLMPWHYQDKYFQTGPKMYKTNLDKYYKQVDIVEVVKDYFGGIGLNIDDILKHSDLFEKEGKYQHAYCTNIDREGDIRVVCNVKPNHKWMSTLLHEFGHAVYDKYVSRKLPWQLRKHAHIFLTESVAMMFGRVASDPQWLKDVINISEEEANNIRLDCNNTLRMEQLIFSRWVQVMYNFEKELYKNPNQNLNKLWWELVEEYQMIRKPEGRAEPDWAAKIHIAIYPAYYHNYMLGEIFASQLYSFIVSKVLKSKERDQHSFYKNRDVGNFLVERIFSHGAMFPWNELIKSALGEELTPRYYARQFVKNDFY